MLAVERRRLQLGWPAWLVEKQSGVQDGYYFKMVYAETPSGRNAGWQTLQLVIDALWPDGVGVRLLGAAVSDDQSLRERINATSRRYRRRNREQYKIPSHLRDFASAKEVGP